MTTEGPKPFPPPGAPAAPSSDAPAATPASNGGPAATFSGGSSVPPGFAGPQMEAPEELTPEDLAARENVAFPLDLEPVLPGPAVGSESLASGASSASPPGDAPAAATPAVPVDGATPAIVAPPAESVVPMAPSAAAGPAPEVAPFLPGPISLEAPEALTPEDLAARENVGFPLDLDVPAAEPSASSAPVMEYAPQPEPKAPLPALPPVAAPSPPPSATAPVDTPAMRHRAAVSAPQSAPLLSRSRQYPVAWAWAGLGHAPVLGPVRSAPRSRGPVESPPSSLAEDLLDLAAVGKGTDGVMEMLLVFKEDALDGVMCKLRMEPAGMQAVFVAADDSARRAVSGIAEDLLARMRRRGLKVAGWSVEVGR